MVEWMPRLQTNRGRLRFFSVSETRLGQDDAGRPVVDNQKTLFAVDDAGAVREANDGEVTEFLGRLLHGPLWQVPQSDESRSGVGR